MGDTARDPIDHHRTTQPLGGETMKNTAKTPGLVLVAVAVVAFVVCLPSFAIRQATSESARRSSHCLLQARRWHGWLWRQDGSAKSNGNGKYPPRYPARRREMSSAV